ncbi:SPLICING FACTOR SF3A-RELATED [Salix purpurea]|uniref:SPLICING FACTOR SF3A-RELATED n=2 Tax=Salix TaxID=40685 RepID=A0A9Q0PGU9_9ROSI|nr:SPLICING FACTOR SF3A-RELATED [Salix koriyanagi]KAJ6760297.1 SPLICING FACTOR SF3A-RELATED [Salix purpurea]
MSSTLLETTRASHEEVERLERLIVKDLQNEPANNKDRLFQSHRVRNMIENIITTTEKIVEIYEDKDNARKDEIAALGGQTAMGTNVFSAFYDRLKEIREYHRRHPAARVVDANEDYEAMLKEEPVIEFTGEEAFGKYLDMHELYNQFNNLKFEKPIEYSTYLDIFSQPHNLPRKVKFTRQYKEYMENLLEYLAYFFQRTEPLQDLDRILSKVTAEFEEQWENGTVQGWEKNAQENGHVPADHTVIDLDFYSTVEELKEVGPEKLKEALAALGLKSGGTVQQRAERLFLTKHTPLEKLDKKHFVKGSHASELNGGAEETQADTESDDDEQQIYNPLKLPMGWDGKPIPYWLYKLHGLGQEFKCEICGNDSYWGRRAFERHFKEWRHQHGMRCLGIPNTKNFNEITSIQEAQELWKRIQARQGVNKWRPELEEEYEDKEGNIYNKKTYTDLQRQGLI